MKTTVLSFVIASILCLTGNAHLPITIGPNGGRLIMIDSTAIPNVEFTLKDNKAQIELLDAIRKPIPITEQSLTLIAGPRSNPVKLTATKADNKFVAGPLPEGDDYFIIFRLKETKAAKPITFRLHYYTHTCEECDKIEWLCICGNKGTGKEIEVPATIDGLWAELNQHHAELETGYQEKEYEAIDEITDAFSILAAALPAKSSGLTSDQKTAVAHGSAEIVQALNKIKEANAARELEDAKAELAAVANAMAALKTNYPAATANTKIEK